jgi:hypothetical protein
VNAESAPLLTPFAPAVWEYNAPLRVLGIEMGHRMAVLRRDDGALLVLSPAQWSAALEAELGALGTPALFVANSTMHDAFWPEWFRAHPGARFLAAPGVQQEHPELTFHGKISDGAPPGWEGTVECLVMRGAPRLNETVLLHRPSGTLCVADLLFHFSGRADAWTQTALWLNDAWGRPTPSRMFRQCIRDRAAFRASIDRLLDWEFDRILLGHGRNIERDGRAVLRRAYAFLK